ncbi:hypothetical protein J6590_046899 [Homalodisca vitripennis]|nr:hypothetical protein J6590_046899 [Homalodisca vitripennis]
MLSFTHSQQQNIMQTCYHGCGIRTGGLLLNKTTKNCTLKILICTLNPLPKSETAQMKKTTYHRCNVETCDVRTILLNCEQEFLNGTYDNLMTAVLSTSAVL